MFSNISACIFELRLLKIYCYYATIIFISILDISRKMKRKMDRKDIAINYIENRKRSAFFAIVSSVTVVILVWRRKALKSRRKGPPDISKLLHQHGKVVIHDSRYLKEIYAIIKDIQRGERNDSGDELWPAATYIGKAVIYLQRIERQFIAPFTRRIFFVK